MSGMMLKSHVIQVWEPCDLWNSLTNHAEIESGKQFDNPPVFVCSWVALGCSWVFPKIVPKPCRNPEKAMGNLPVIAFPPRMCLSLPKA